MLPVQVIWLLGYLLNYIWVIYCPIYLMNPLCLGYSVIGLFVGLQMKKSAIFFISWCGDMLPVQVIWLLGYLVNYIWVIHCPIYLMNPLCLGYSVIG